MIRLADEMAQPVVEVFAVSRCRDMIPGRRIDVAEADAGLDDTFRLLVRFPHQIVDFQPNTKEG